MRPRGKGYFLLHSNVTGACNCLLTLLLMETPHPSGHSQQEFLRVVFGLLCNCLISL